MFPFLFFLPFHRLQIRLPRAGHIAQHDPGVDADGVPVGLIRRADGVVFFAEGKAVPEADADVMDRACR